MNASITTIIPTYRRPRLLRRAIASVLAQTHRDLQVSVYDNASGDETPSVVAEIAAKDSRVSYYQHAEHVKAAENFLFGMRRVSTPYFSFLSDDDVLFPNFYQSAVSKLHADPDALFAAGSAIEFDETGTVRYAPLALWPRQGRFTPPEGFRAMLGNKHPTWTAILFRRDVLEKVGLLDAGIVGPFDLDYELRVAVRFPYLVFFEPSAGYLHHQDRVSSAEDSGVIAGFEQIAGKLSGDDRIDPTLRALIPSLLARQMRFKLYEIALKSVVEGRDTSARDAAAVLRNRFASPLVSWVISVTVAGCERFPALRRAIAWLESERLRGRSAQARRHQRAWFGQDPSVLAAYLNIPGVSP